MDSIPFESSNFDLIISIGVLHNAITIDEFEHSIKEISRLLKQNAYAIVSVFTNDVITSDLIKKSDNLYNIIDRPPMVLLSKEQVDKIFIDNNLIKLKVIEEHVTNVGSGKRNVYSILLQK
jgi:ubiquinone/menaquinone biosynthesis C-methylase UbiE